MDKIAVFSTDLGSWGRPVDRIAIFSTDSGAPRPRSRKDNPSTCDFSAAALDPPAKPVEKVAVSSGAGLAPQDGLIPSPKATGSPLPSHPLPYPFTSSNSSPREATPSLR